MLVTQGMSELLRKDDAKQYHRQIKFFSKEFNKHLSVSLYVLYYVLLVFDESVIRFTLQCFLHVFLSHMIDELDRGSDVIPGVTRTEAFTRIFNPANETAPNAEEDQDSEGLVNNQVQGFFRDWTLSQRSELASRIFTLFLTSWVTIILFQIAFCLDDTYNGIAYEFSGKLRESIRRTAYDDSYLKNSDLWSVSKAFTMGGLMTNWIGDFRFRSKVWKLFGILTIDFIIINIQIVSLINNYGIGLGVVKRFDTESDDVDEEEERSFNGLQGGLTIMRINPLKAFRDLAMAPKT